MVKCSVGTSSEGLMGGKDLDSNLEGAGQLQRLVLRLSIGLSGAIHRVWSLGLWIRYWANQL